MNNLETLKEHLRNALQSDQNSLAKTRAENQGLYGYESYLEGRIQSLEYALNAVDIIFGKEAK